VITAVGRLGHLNLEFDTSLGYTARLSQKSKSNKQVNKNPQVPFLSNISTISLLDYKTS
jgi:hypothetical protein